MESHTIAIEYNLFLNHSYILPIYLRYAPKGFPYGQSISHIYKFKNNEKQKAQTAIPKAQRDSIVDECKIKANEPVHKSNQAESNNNSPLQEVTLIKCKTNWLSLSRMQENVPGYTHQSHLPYSMEPIGSQMLIPCFNCQARGQLMLIQGILKGSSSCQLVLAAPRTLPQNSPTRANWPQAARLLDGSPKIDTELRFTLLATW